MTYAGDRRIFDANSHVMETREWLDPYLDPEVRRQLRPLYGHKPGRIDKLLDEAKARKGDAAAVEKIERMTKCVCCFSIAMSMRYPKRK